MSSVLLLPLLAVFPLDDGSSLPSENVVVADSIIDGEAHGAPFDARECVALFGRPTEGDPRDVPTLVSRSTHTVDVTYGVSTWQAPRLVSLPGIEFVRSEEVDDGVLRAVLRVREDWADECPAGDYVVPALASLGVDGRIIAVLEEGVLAEHRGALIFIPQAGRRGPAFRMIWRSGFGLSVSGGTPGSTSSAPKNGKAADKKSRRQKRGRANKATVKATVANQRAGR